MNQLTPQEEAEAIATMRTFIERARVMERLKREGVEGKRVDAADKCICSCGNVHYRTREAK